MSRLLAWTTTVGADAVLRPVVWFTGPVFEKELRVAARRRRNFVLRFAYLVALTAFVFAVWGSTGAIIGGTSTTIRSLVTPHVGRGIVLVVLEFQFFVLPVLAAIMLSGSISEEIRSRTLSMLMVTPVSSFRIVLGKLLSGLLQIGLLLAVSLPLLVVVRIMGGVDIETVILGLAITATTCLFVGAISILLSTFLRSATAAVAVALAMLVFLLLFQVLFLEDFRSHPTWPTLILGATQIANPYAMFRACVADPDFMAWSWIGSPGPRAWLGSPEFLAAALCAVHCGIILTASRLALVWCARRVRKIGLRQALGQDRSAAVWEGFMRPKAISRRKESDPIRCVTGSPVLWRERQVHFGPSRFLGIVAWSVLASGVAILDIVALFDHRTEAAEVYFGNSLVLFGAGIFVTLIQAAPGLSAEKEGRTLPVLLCSPMTAGHILFDKALGAFLRALPVWGLLAANILLYAVLGYVHPIVILHMLLLTTGVIVFFTGTGLYFAARVRRASAAVALNLGLAFALYGAPIAVAYWMPMDPRTRVFTNPAEVFAVCHPIGQAWILLLGAVQAHSVAFLPKNTPTLIYEWGWMFGKVGWPGTSVLALLMAGAYAGLGLIFGAGAGRLLRRGAA